MTATRPEDSKINDHAGSNDSASGARASALHQDAYNLQRTSDRQPHHQTKVEGEWGKASPRTPNTGWKEHSKQATRELESKGMLPKLDWHDSGPHTGLDQAGLASATRNTFANPKSSAEDKLAALQTLSKNGVSQIDLPDKDGHMHQYTIENEAVKNSDRSMVHLYGKDDRGHQHVAMRGVANGDGTFEKERDSKGDPVDWNGSLWSGSQESSSKGAGSPDQPVAGQKPSDATDSKLPSAPARPPDSSASSDFRAPSATYHARGTGYFPENSAMEGGYKDMKGHQLYTLPQYLDGKAPYVSVAMDNHAGIKYGQPVNIPEMNQKYGQQIPFRVVDTGSAFRGRGHSRIDICVSNRAQSHDATINGPLTLEFGS